jgi:hypothetical protein
MSLAFGVDLEADLIGALSVPRGFAPRAGGGSALASLDRLLSPARAFSRRAAILFHDRARLPARRLAARAAEREIRDAFDRLADAVGLDGDERGAFFDRAHSLSCVILGLETLGAALDCLGAADSVGDWLRAESTDEVFKGRAPLRAMAEDGRLAVELTLLHLRARQRGLHH